MTEDKRRAMVSRISLIGNYLPRRCGIATYTTNLCNALTTELDKKSDLCVVAMDDIPQGYNYPERVKFSVRANVQTDYYWAADFLNANQYEVAILQHEFGIFGGEDGSYILHLLKALRMPVITNLHTVIKEPTRGQKVIINEISRCSDKLLVMSHKAKELLLNAYNVSGDKITFIPHEIPDVSFGKPGMYNDLFGIKGKDMILTFGLLGPGKGIENMIRAMPAIVEKHPNSVYVILGQTHPHVKEVSGEAYRHSLQQLANELGIRDYVIFYNQFVSDDMLIQYLQSAKIYAIPYLRKEQITSGTVAYAVGVGAAIVSTPFWYAEEILAEGRGRLVPFNDPQAMAGEIIKLLENDQERESMRSLAYQYGRSMVYKEVVRRHLDIISDVRELRRRIPIDLAVTLQNHKVLDELPEINLFHLKSITDDTGVLQHANYNVPDVRFGYCTDDNARALIALSIYYSLRKDKTILPMLTKYLTFLHFAFNPENARFRNFLSYDRQWLEDSGSEDSHARAIWALGIAVKYSPNSGIRNMAMRLFHNALTALERLSSPRSWAFGVVGLDAYLNKYGGDSQVRRVRTHLAEKLFELFKRNSDEDWPWLENTLTYANAKLPHAMILAGQWIPNAEMFDMGTHTLEWLLRIQKAEDDHLSIIGNSGWYSRGGEKANFDQQPIEAMSLIDACIDVYIATGDIRWFQEAQCCLGWFLGRNDLNIPVYNFETGGCCDALQPDGLNENQGAESTISCLISLLKMYKIMGMHNLIADKKALFGGES
ncbi:MAG: glycosyltransferase family 4 protein [Thermodesulfobacteriota bacterium]|nr:glycosyltransferase family 4 protein [Thermodesulfobacteriota bacterium]